MESNMTISEYIGVQYKYLNLAGTEIRYSSHRYSSNSEIREYYTIFTNKIMLTYDVASSKLYFSSINCNGFKKVDSTSEILNRWLEYYLQRTK